MDGWSILVTAVATVLTWELCKSIVRLQTEVHAVRKIQTEDKQLTFDEPWAK